MTDQEASQELGAFTEEVHAVLRQLYDTAALSQSPVIRALGLDKETNPAIALRGVLTEAIDALKPNAGVPKDSRDARAHRVLFHRYIQGFSQRQVALTLSVSERQVRRDEARGVELLSNHLQAVYLASPRSGGMDTDATDRAPALTSAHSHGSARDRELAWVEESFPTESSTLEEIIRSALSTLEPVLQASGVRVRSKAQDSLPPVLVKGEGIRQALLSIVSIAAPRASAGWVDILCETVNAGVRLRVAAAGRRGHALTPLSHEECERLAMARRLVELARGSLDIADEGDARHPFTVSLTLATAGQNVLFVDDNADTLRLYQHYLIGTRYSFIGACDASGALELVARSSPRAVVLDIMLPGVDGWQLLTGLRDHPLAADVPIIVCSILPEESLALALGAAAFLRKPVTLEVLLSTLNRLALPPAQTGPLMGQ